MSLIRHLIIGTETGSRPMAVSEFINLFAYTTFMSVYECRTAPVVRMKCIYPLRITIYEKQANNIGIISMASIVINSYNKIMGSDGDELSVAANSLNRIMENNEFNSSFIY